MVGLHRIANLDRPVVAIHSATSFSLLSTDPSVRPILVTLAAKSTVSTDILSTRIQTSSYERTGLIVVDSAGRWANVTLEGSGPGTRAVLQKEGRLSESECRFQSASISSDGVITAIGKSQHIQTKEMRI